MAAWRPSSSSASCSSAGCTPSRRRCRDSELKLLQIDAFTSDAFKGNPAAVLFMDGARDDRWMANVAAEMNLAETAFLTPSNSDWRLRWFTPTLEIDLC